MNTTATNLAGLAASLTVVMQVAAPYLPMGWPLWFALVFACLLALKVAPRPWKSPTDWLVCTALILTTANGATNIAANAVEGRINSESVSSIDQRPESDRNPMHHQIHEWPNFSLIASANAQTPTPAPSTNAPPIVRPTVVRW